MVSVEAAERAVVMVPRGGARCHRAASDPRRARAPHGRRPRWRCSSEPDAFDAFESVMHWMAFVSDGVPSCSAGDVLTALAAVPATSPPSSFDTAIDAATCRDDGLLTAWYLIGVILDEQGKKTADRVRNDRLSHTHADLTHVDGMNAACSGSWRKIACSDARGRGAGKLVKDGVRA
jgi:hypothetical protein